MIHTTSETWSNPMRSHISGVVCLILTAGAAIAAPAGKLAPNDIQATFFNGMPFTSSTPQAIKYTMVFTADGKMTREPQGKTGNKGEGVWKLSKDGFCTTWKNSAGQLLHAGDGGRQQMVGDQRYRRDRHLVEVGANSGRHPEVRATRAFTPFSAGFARASKDGCALWTYCHPYEARYSPSKTGVSARMARISG